MIFKFEMSYLLSFFTAVIKYFFMIQVAIGGAVIGWRYFKGTEEERAAMLANVNAGQER